MSKNCELCVMSSEVGKKPSTPFNISYVCIDRVPMTPQFLIDGEWIKKYSIKKTHRDLK